MNYVYDPRMMFFGQDPIGRKLSGTLQADTRERAAVARNCGFFNEDDGLRYDSITITRKWPGKVHVIIRTVVDRVSIDGIHEACSYTDEEDGEPGEGEPDESEVEFTGAVITTDDMLDTINDSFEDWPETNWQDGEIVRVRGAKPLWPEEDFPEGGAGVVLAAQRSLAFTTNIEGRISLTAFERESIYRLKPEAWQTPARILIYRIKRENGEIIHAAQDGTSVITTSGPLAGYLSIEDWPSLENLEPTGPFINYSASERIYFQILPVWAGGITSVADLRPDA